MIHLPSAVRPAIFLSLLIGLGCQPSPPNGSNNPAHPDTSATGSPPSPNTDMRVSGTIHSVNVEGGCWRLDAQNGGHYEILKSSAPSGLLEDGKQVTLTVKARPDLMSTCQIGPIVEIVRVE